MKLNIVSQSLQAA